jgi:hypothetical protein
LDYLKASNTLLNLVETETVKYWIYQTSNKILNKYKEEPSQTQKRQKKLILMVALDGSVSYASNNLLMRQIRGDIRGGVSRNFDFCVSYFIY